MRLLSLDQASHTTGAAFFEDGELIGTAEFTLRNRAERDRLVLQVGFLRDQVRSFGPEVVVLEDVHLGSDEIGRAFVRTALELAQLLGALRLACYDLDLRVMTVSSPELIEYLYGHQGHPSRENKKAASIQMALLDISASAFFQQASGRPSDHVADAVNLGRVALGKLKEEGWAAVADREDRLRAGPEKTTVLPKSVIQVDSNKHIP